MPTYSILTAKDTMLIFAYAPAGLGHLRVTDALYDGLPESADPLILGSNDEFIRKIHRIGSTYRGLKQISDLLQKEGISKYFSRYYSNYLRSHTKNLYFQLRTILEERLEKPAKVLVVATHFGLAHQLAAIKFQLEMEEQVKIFLAVVVTDDSPQEIWYVDGADAVFVPSAVTKRELESYGEWANLSKTKFIVNPYPVSPKLGKILDQSDMQDKLAQVDPALERKIHVSLPISGAAVGTSFNTILMQSLHEFNSRFYFHVISKNAPYTKEFLQTCLGAPYIKTDISVKDRETVTDYEALFEKEVIPLEITKPSEQAFKAIFPANCRGGAILLFSKPVGRQEYDNLNFLRRHYLLPDREMNIRLWRMAEAGERVNEKDELNVTAGGWRGLLLPDEPVAAAGFINWCLREKIFMEMFKNRGRIGSRDTHPEELGNNGVKKFWDRVEKLVS